MIFLCDEMLKRLAHWLRAAGYDACMLPDGSRDAALLQRAERDGRVLLTRDQALAGRHVPGLVIHFVLADTLQEQVRELTSAFALDWLLAPFSRCLSCNSLLQAATAEQAGRLPPGVLADLRRHAGATPDQPLPEPDLRYCHACRRLYWEGSHVRRMRKQLLAWKQGRFARPDAG